MRLDTSRAVLFMTVVAVAACESSTGAAGGPEVRVDSVADTVRVHTISGSRWGGVAGLAEQVRIGAVDGTDEEILGAVSGLAAAPDGGVYVYDRQAPALRRYGPDGAYIGTLGRAGGGPGEYANSDGGVAVLPDGRVVLRDPGNARFTVFGPGGGFDASWPGRGGHFTSQPLATDTAGNLYTIVTQPPTEDMPGWPGSMWVTRVVRISPEGAASDTLDIPRYAFAAAELRARSDAGSMTSIVPYTGQFHWAVHTTGGFVTAVGDRYAVDLHVPGGGVVRMMRNPEPVRVIAEEKAAVEQRTTESMRRMVPDWSWNATPIPDVKAPIEGLAVGTDGRIWVRVATPSVRVPEAGDGAPQDRLPRFRSAPAWDVFEADGAYLGRVEGPLELSPHPAPAFARDHIWAVTRDSLGVDYVTRFAIRSPDGGAPTGSR